VPYADVLVLLLQNMMARKRQPLIHQIPPSGGRIPDALFYWSGDEYFGPAALSVQASDFMKEKGLPYHINIGVEQRRGCRDGHPMTGEEFEHITEDNGHEISLWFRLYDDDNREITAESVRYQVDLFRERYGIVPGCTLMASCNWQGWAEPARFMAQAGVRADNTFTITAMPPVHPHFLNSAAFGFGHGTAFPFYFYDDHTQGNVRIDCLEQPMICYEIGHRGSSAGNPNIPGPDKETGPAEEVHLPVDMAVKYHFVMNVFYHPGYVVNFPRCREAIEEMLRYIKYRKANVLHMGNNAVQRWWDARRRSTVTGVNETGRGLTFESRCAYPDGMIVKIPVDNRTVGKVTDGGGKIPHAVKREFGGDWLYLIVPEGNRSVEISWEGEDADTPGGRR